MLCKLKLTKICIQSLLWLLNDMLMRVLSIIFFLLVSLYSSFAQITLDTLVDTNLVFQCSDIALDQSGNVILAGKSTEYPSLSYFLEIFITDGSEMVTGNKVIPCLMPVLFTQFV